MNTAKPFLYKDAKPAETIGRIRAILSELGLFVTEGSWFDNGAYLHSVRIASEVGLFGANGKGMSKEAALASAYAELMERLQNQWHTPVYLDLVLSYNRSRQAADFAYSPDEVLLTPSEFVDSAPTDLLTELAPRDHEHENHLEWLERLAHQGQLLCVPFADVLGGSVVPLPLELIRFHYGSTGMCAGNTPHEALVQGLSEVAERHAIDVIYHERLTPPEIASDALAGHAVLEAMVDQIESSGIFTLSMRDCSLGLNLPVVAVVLHNRARGTYHVHLGAHPNVDEAISRSLTETFQGRAISDDRGETAANFNNPLFADAATSDAWSGNFRSLLRLSYGAYPNAFFLDEPSFPASLSLPTEALDSRSAYELMLHTLHEATHGPILVRDVSFLGFPSFHVIVPGMNTRKHRLADLELHLQKRRLGKRLVDLDEKSQAELMGIRDTIEKVCDHEIETRSIADLTWAPLRAGCQWSKVEPHLLLSSLNLAAGSLDRAMSSVEAFMDRAARQEGSGSLESLNYFRALRDYLVLRDREKREPDSARAILTSFYHEQLVNEVVRNVDGGKRPFDDLMVPRCFDCDRCELEKQCDVGAWGSVYCRLREQMANSGIKQDDLLRAL